MFLAKNLGVANFGLYSVAFSYYSLIATVADFGITRFLIREIAIDKSLLPALFRHAIVLRLASSFTLFIIFGVGLFLVDPNQLRVTLILLAVLAILPQTITLTIDNIFVALQKLSLSSIGLMVLSLSTTISGIVFLNKFSIYGAVAAILFGQLIYLLSLTLLALYQGVDFFGKLTSDLTKDIIKGSIPYGILGILGLLYFKVDTIILNYLKGSFDTGIYSAAYRFLEAVIYIPGAISIALFPVFAKLSATNPDKVYKLYSKALIILLFVSLVILISFVVILPWLINWLIPQYAPSISVLRILALSIPFFFMNSPQSVLLLSHRRFINKLLIISIIILSLNIILNLLFIPKFSYIAAAWVTLVTEILVFVIFFILIRRNYKN